jgi:peptidoglycan/xylan/chitin deacetylase (PgdA/CDA1 family)
MNRRTFLRGAATAAAVFGGYGLIRGGVPRPEVAITMDDFNLADTPPLTAVARNTRILDALDAHRVRAAGFVTGQFLDSDAKMALVAEWSKRGHMIGNHTFSHWEYPNADFGAFCDDTLRCEALLSKLPTYTKMFRFPYLKEGTTAEQRDRMRLFLRDHGYRNGHVTIDASDWYVDSRLRKRLQARPDANQMPYRDFYLEHIWERAQYYDGLARKVLGRTIRHTLLIHHNLLNGLFLGDLLGMFERKGWRVVDARYAFEDPVFRAEPKVAPAGESLVWALAKETGRFEKSLRYPGEDGAYEKLRMNALGL